MNKNRPHTDIQNIGLKEKDLSKIIPRKYGISRQTNGVRFMILFIIRITDNAYIINYLFLLKLPLIY